MKNPVYDVVRISQVCCSWRTLALECPNLWVVISTAQGREHRNAAVSRSEQSLLCVQLDVTRYVDFDSENEDDGTREES